MFNREPATLFNVVFNVPQGLFMTIVICAYQGLLAPEELAVSFAKTYCAGVMLTTLLRLNAAGAWVSRNLHTDKHNLSNYLTTSITIGAIMGILMNTVLSFINVGFSTFFKAWLHCLGVSISASVLASCVFSYPINRLVEKVSVSPES